MNKNEEFEVIITDMSDEGAGIGKYAGFTWFVKDAVIGDKVLAGVTKQKKNYGFARLIKVLEPSKDRIEAACPIARQCGGCQLQALSYEGQLRFKENKVLNNLRRLGGFDLEKMQEAGFEILPILGMNEPYYYRNKAQFPVGRNRDGKAIAGFYAGRTHNIIPCTDCMLGCKENKIILETILDHMNRNNIVPYDEIKGTGVLRHVLIRKGRTSKKLMVCLVINTDKYPKLSELTELLLSLKFEDGSSIASISCSVNKEKTNVIMGAKIRNVYGPGYIEDSISCLEDKKLSFRISPLSFYQVNPVQMERLYKTALDFAELSGTENVWDLYCGIGTISLFLAQKAKKVYGVEIIPQAIENAKDNAERNSMDNTEFFVGKAEEVLPEWYKKNPDEKIDVIVVDPPRKGCDEACLKTMAEMSPEKIVYVSCDSATLARDLKFLCANGYELKKVRACDMFPQTVHVECIALLQRVK
ncbi:MAG: 23S rRNA (uracil(1939)-C(5))-methyltransferase RlmD [Eubacteriales bacterium]|nr:23S rRNA (uracil(1939)-C(5))-methyltransferase RlmD [Eubacteriales bacterium]